MVSIVDDDASIRRAVSNLLLSLGFQVQAFESAEAFLQSAPAESSGCLVLDVRMAGMSGLELMAHLMESGRRIPTIILTAHADEVLRERALNSGAVAFLRKPFRGDALIEAVNTALNCENNS